MHIAQCTPKSFLQSAYESHCLLGDGDQQQKEALFTETVCVDSQHITFIRKKLHIIFSKQEHKKYWSHC